MRKLYLLFGLIIFTAFFLRFFALGENPPSVNWDEASLGYNAYAILKTGADEYGNPYPISIRSFDDHKPPLYVYLAIPFIALFGLTEFAVRFPSALFGSLTVIVTFFFVKELFSSSARKMSEHEELFFVEKIISRFYRMKNLAFYLAFLSMGLFAISPWHLQFSRAAFEGNIGLFFLTLGLLYFLKGLKMKWFLLGAVICFALSMYSYHSFRLITPLLFFSLLVLFWRELKSYKQYIALSIVTFVVLLSPIAYTFFFSHESGSRLSMVTIFNDENILEPAIKRLTYDQQHGEILGNIFHNRRFIYGLAIAKGYLDHFNPDFLFLHGDGGVQHHAVDVGMLYLWELPFLAFGLCVFLYGITRKRAVLLLWLLVAPIASSLTTGTPHPVRAIAMIPALHIFSIIGLLCLFNFVFSFRQKLLQYMIIVFIGVFICVNVFYYFHQYYVHTPIEYGYFWQSAYKQAFQYAKEHEGEYDTIVMTYQYDQPYIFYLFYNRIDPAWYQNEWRINGKNTSERMKRSIGKYQFHPVNWSIEKDRKNALIIAAPDEIPLKAKILKVIYYLDGKIAFKIAKT